MNTFDKIVAGMMGGMAIWVAVQVRRNYIDGRASGIGKVERVKRRIYKEIAIAQQKGIDLNIKYIDMPSPMRNALREVGEQFGWKQSSRSAASGKTYEEAYYNSLKRAYNAVSGFEDVEGVGAVYNVRNAEGRIVLTWNDVQDAADHVRQEPDAIEVLEQKNANLRKRIRNRSRKLPVIYNMQAEDPANENYAELPGEYEIIQDKDGQLSIFGIGSNSVSGNRYFRVDYGVAVLSVEGFENGKPYEIWKAYQTPLGAKSEMHRIAKEYFDSGYDVEPDDEHNPTQYKMYIANHPEEEAIVKVRMAKMYR